MKNVLIILFVAAVSVTSTANAEISLSVNIGTPAPPPHRMSVSSPPSIRFEVAPLFVASSRLGFYIGVETPYDIIFSADNYYLYYSNSWHRSRHYNGPWAEIPYREMPPDIRKHRIEQIRSYRDREYRTYQKDRNHYRGRSFRPDHERKEYIKEERRHDKEQNKGERHQEKREHKERRQDGKRDSRD
ncbi:MAG: hypothetical protein PHY09_08570 [Desulfuromonadaceae bacterium]|nr:hypothetical protein [Desulfuromonadaceae bacterium]MDD5106819.1 hypothetical protein [Desulfuromonadaceae bacterium]